MQEGTIGEIRLLAGNFAPRQWSFCDGRTLEIQNNRSLFSVIGSRYGGDGRVNFQLPNLESLQESDSGHPPIH
ncbi:MAG: tail fiber protein [Gammaproteobacteria bacterium]|nr:tail fiber protein [Gammaproteobacteria bacterium]